MKKMWLVVVGAMLFIALPVYAAKPGTEAQPTKVEVVGEVKVAESPIKPDPTSAPCYPSKDIRTSDLCAQWKAADAARDSANWAAFAIVASVLTLCGVGVTVWQTQQTVRITQETLHADRAWITPRIPKIIWEGYEGADFKPFEPTLSIIVTWENTGRSPALNIRHRANFRLIPKDVLPPAFEPDKIHHIAALGVGRPFKPLLQKISGNLAVEYLTGEIDLYVYSIVEYEDIFGKPHQSEICYKLSPRKLKRSGSAVAFKTIGKAYSEQNRLT